ncbi:MAG TPA: VOC family protein [Acidimicrobiales bacterium]|nr:VOC family protein [Acidimicrobiales bacterium]
MIDHIYLPVTDIDRSLDFYTAVLTPLDLAHRWEFKARAGWPDLYGFGGDMPGFWLKRSSRSFPELYVAFIARSEEAVQNAYDAALSHGGMDNGAPGLRPHFDPRYYAANVLDPDGYSLEICFKPWLYDGSSPVANPVAHVGTP